MKQIIAVDVDDVLVPHFQGLIEWYNKSFGTHLTLAHNHPTDVTPWGAATIEEAVRRVHGYYQTEAFKNEQPYQEAIEVLGVLAERYELVIITGRDEIIEEATERWLNRHFPQLFRETHFSRQYSLEGKSRPKAEIIKEIGASYFIDDYLPAVREVAAAGINSVLFGDYPWSATDVLPAHVTRCRDWAAVQRYFDGRA